jgi:hypothetical protein
MIQAGINLLNTNRFGLQISLYQKMHQANANHAMLNRLMHSVYGPALLDSRDLNIADYLMSSADQPGVKEQLHKECRIS